MRQRLEAALRSPYQVGGKTYWIPGHMMDGITNYIFDRVEPGGFLRAVLENNLVESLARADTANLNNIHAWAAFLYNVAPAECWGSKEKVSKWLAGKDES